MKTERIMSAFEYNLFAGDNTFLESID